MILASLKRRYGEPISMMIGAKVVGNFIHAELFFVQEDVHDRTLVYADPSGRRYVVELPSEALHSPQSARSSFLKLPLVGDPA